MEQNGKTIAEILKNAPKGTKLYSTIYGECMLRNVSDVGNIFVFVNEDVYCFTATGRFHQDFEGAECLLFPSRDNRSWADFEYNHQFKPFDKVIVRDAPNDTWQTDFFSYYNDDDKFEPFACTGGAGWKYCLPYNEMTAKLIGTTDELNG